MKWLLQSCVNTEPFPGDRDPGLGTALYVLLETWKPLLLSYARPHRPLSLDPGRGLSCGAGGLLWDGGSGLVEGPSFHFHAHLVCSQIQELPPREGAKEF